jgi:hypothetical protein
MTRIEAMELLKRGRYKEWNSYRENNPDWIPDLSNADLSDVRLIFGQLGEEFNLDGANLCAANLSNIENLRSGIKGNSKGKMLYKLIGIPNAVYDVLTKFPEGYHPTDRGAKLVSTTGPMGIDREQPPKVFFSYAWVNEAVVLAVDQWLRLKGIETKIDQRDFFAGSGISDEILRIMRECDVVVTFYSKDAKNKPWIQFESELAKELETKAKAEGKRPPRIIYFVMDETPLPEGAEDDRIAVMAKGKKFEVICEELYYSILQISRSGDYIDLKNWSDFVF